ncbi:hypothetical protein [Amycolatopsis jejuensis]|uniref:hypothetical protein n=1 Tax=Amycolatopsis jejuensis TaxID=330084 RepID=UPI000524A7C0|nr:hypothetical protein [Amycolatopsis jejuensis]
MAGKDFKVDPAELDKFSGYLEKTTSPAVKQAAADVHTANGFDNQAFGIFLAQVFAVPARITMGVVAGNLDKISGNVTETADLTKKAAKAYRDQDATAKDGIDKFLPEIGK